MTDAALTRDVFEQRLYHLSRSRADGISYQMVLAHDQAQRDEITRLEQERDAALARVAALEGALQKYADANNWGYYDESGCRKGIGKSYDACFLGPDEARHALEFADVPEQPPAGGPR